MRIADAVWAATALLHQENPAVEDFEVQEIVSRAVEEDLVGGFRPGFQPHVSWHCVANKKPNGGRYRMLYETVRGRRRLLRMGDPWHPDRNGDIRPEKAELPPDYQSLIDWYDTIYSRRSPAATPVPAELNGPNAGKERDFESRLATGSLQSGTGFVTSLGAVVIPENLRRELEIQEGTRVSIYREGDRLVLQPVNDKFIHSFVGCCKGEDSLVQAREREHRMEK